MMAPIVLALAFAAMIVYAVECTRAQALLRALTAIGRMAFTNYIAHSIIFDLVFFGSGLGQFGKLRAAPVFAIGLLVHAVQVRLSTYRLRRYRFGPIEWLWRTLMHGRRQPMKRRLQEAVEDLPAALVDRKHIADQEVNPVAVRDQQ